MENHGGDPARTGRLGRFLNGTTLDELRGALKEVAAKVAGRTKSPARLLVQLADLGVGVGEDDAGFVRLGLPRAGR